MQCVCTRAAQNIITTDKQQRPLISMFFTFAGTALTSILTAIFTILNKSNSITSSSLWNKYSIICIIMSAVFTFAAIWGLSKNDKPKYYKKVKEEKIKYRAMLNVIRHNRALQMLIVAASTDKLGKVCVGAVQLTFT